MTPRALWRQNLLMAALMLVGGIVLSVFSERIFAGNGLGYDGCTYGAIITRYEEVRSGTLILNSGIYLRMIPAQVIRTAMMALGVPLTVPNVITTFQVINVLLLTLAAWLWGRCGDRLKLSSDGKWLGFLALFCNYAVLKYTFYYPVLLDTASLVCGVILAWLYLCHRPQWLLVAGVPTFFIAPNVGLQAFLLFLLPTTEQGKPPLLPWPVAATLTLLTVGTAWWVLSASGPYEPLAETISLFAIAGSSYCLTRTAGFSPSVLSQPGMLIRVGVVAAAVVVLTILPSFMSGFSSNDWVSLFFQYARQVLVNSVARPGEFLVAHALYFGPFILVAVCLFFPVCRAARLLGGGWLLVLAFGVLQSLNPLSRQMVGIWPFLVIPVCLVLCDRPLPRPLFWGVAVSSLVCSKVWQRINVDADFSLPLENQPNVWARYLESTGWWMRDPDYLRQGAIILCGLVVMAVILVRIRTTKIDT